MNATSLRRLGAAGALLAAIITPNVIGQAHAAAASQPKGHRTFKLQFLGQTSIGTPQAAVTTRTLGPGPEGATDPGKVDAPGGLGNGGVATQVPTGTPSSIGMNNPNKLTGIDGLNVIEGRYNTDAGNNALYFEPPDQCLAAHNNLLFEAVNGTVAVYSGISHQKMAGPWNMNTFFRQPFSYNRTTHQYGPSIGDPNCLYDAGVQRYFFSVYYIPANGDYSQSGALIAVSQTSNPMDKWSIFFVNTSDTPPDPNTQYYPGCPCFGDYPHIGTDSAGFYLDTNNFENLSTTGDFAGSDLYMISKHALASAATGGSNLQQTTPTPDVYEYYGIPDPGNIYGGQELPAFTVSPARSVRGQYDTANGGTEFLLESNDYFVSAEGITVYALTNTTNLDTGNNGGFPALQAQPVASEVYTSPPSSNQKPGPYPYNKSQGLPEPYTDSGDTRVFEVSYAAGTLWTTLDTAVQASDGSTKAGIAWFHIRPGFTNGALTATMLNQGYVIAGRNNATYGVIGATTDGHAAMGFTVVGQDYYPSTAYSVFNTATGQFGPIHISVLGQAPDDGFTANPVYSYGRCNPINVDCGRWGDYGEASVDDTSGALWIANEYIPGDFTLSNGAPTIANWGTYMTEVNPYQAG